MLRVLRNPKFGLVLALVASASTWVYVSRILKPYQVAEAAAEDRPRGNLSDLYPRWLGARELLLHHRNPYNPEITREIQQGYYGRPIDPSRPNDPTDQQAFAYPLFVVFVLGPSVGLPFPIVQKAFLLLLVLVTVASTLSWQEALGWRMSQTAKATWIILVLGSFPATQGLRLQQLTLLVAALIAASMQAIARKRLPLAGILLAIATIKPQLVFLLVAWLFIWVLGSWQDRKRLFWSYAMSMAGLVVASEWLLPGWIREFRAASAAYYRYTGGGRSAANLLLGAFWGELASVILVAAFLVLAWSQRRVEPETPECQWLIAVAIAITLLVIPMFAPYNEILLVYPGMLIVRDVRGLWKKSPVTRLIVIITGFSVCWPWFSAALLVGALLFLPTPLVEKAWALPLVTTFVIPATLFALLLLGRDVLGRQS